MQPSPALTTPLPGRWPWPPLLRVSVAVHAGALAALALPGAWPWAIGAVAANHALLTGIGLWPRSRALGPNLVRLPDAAIARREIALTFDDGPDPAVTPKLLDLLARERVRATFFVIAARAREHRSIVREIVAAGHDVQNHSNAHRHHFSIYGSAALRREIEAAQATIGEITGAAPHCFRAPAGLRSPLLDPVLHRLGLHLVSWTRRGFDTREADPARVLARLARDLGAGDILLLHDGHARRTDGGTPVLLEVLPALLDRIRAAGLQTVTLAHAVPRRHALP